MYYGAYPAVVLEEKEEDKVRLLRSYFDSVIVRDLGIVKPNVAEIFARFIIENYANPISINKVYNYLRGLGISIGKETVIELFERGKETYFLFTVEEFEKSEWKRKANPKKVYIVDTSYSIALGNEFSILRAMENAVFLELLRRGKKEIFYWKGKKEVDFVISSNFKPTTLIQVTYTSEKPSEREIEGIIEGSGQELTSAYFSLLPNTRLIFISFPFIPSFFFSCSVWFHPSLQRL